MCAVATLVWEGAPGAAVSVEFGLVKEVDSSGPAFRRGSRLKGIGGLAIHNGCSGDSEVV